MSDGELRRNLLARKRPGDTRKPPGRCARWVRERAHLACRPLLQREHDVDHAHEEHEHHERADLQPSVRRARHLVPGVPCSPDAGFQVLAGAYQGVAMRLTFPIPELVQLQFPPRTRDRLSGSPCDTQRGRVSGERGGSGGGGGEGPGRGARVRAGGGGGKGGKTGREGPSGSGPGAPIGIGGERTCRKSSSMAYFACAGWQMQFQKLLMTCCCPWSTSSPPSRPSPLFPLRLRQGFFSVRL